MDLKKVMCQSLSLGNYKSVALPFISVAMFSNMGNDKHRLLQVGLTFALVTGISCCARIRENQVTRSIKNGVVDIYIDNNHIGLNIVKNDRTTVNNVLHIQNANSSSPLAFSSCSDSESICITHGDVGVTQIKASSNSEIISISRIVNNNTAEIIDCYELSDGTQWFGGPQLRYQHWPIQHMRYEEEPYLPTHPLNMALAERYWLSSKGMYIFVEDVVPLFLDQNNYKDKSLCLIAKNKAPYYRWSESVVLNYEIGVFANPRLAHENAILRHLGSPIGSPDSKMVQHPIWSTWARYKADVNADVVSEFADEITKHGFNNSQLEIDDNWETCYGSAIFDSAKFPDVKSLTDSLKGKGFRVTLWIHPFINEGCEPAYTDALNSGYFAKTNLDEVRTAWWQGEQAGVIDFTNPSAVEWWTTRLKNLQTATGIDSFKFDAGEVSWLPQPPVVNSSDELPGYYTSAYVRALASNFNPMIEARVGWRTQDLPIFIRMIDKDTKWTWNNGLPTLITTLLQMNLNGYVHVLPDMIGGNGYLNGLLNGTEYPSEEMFVRWLQTNVFMPSLQYSFVPWDYGDEIIELCRKYTDLHAEIAPTIIRLMQESVETGAPLNPPIWWVDPTNAEAHKIKDQFLLGEEILVAPVIEQDAINRNIYLPRGTWKDANTNLTYTGPRWLIDYPAPLDILPYFYKL